MPDTHRPNTAVWTLSIDAPDRAAQQLPLDDGEWTVGASAACDVCLDDAGPRHVLLQLAGGQARVVWPAADGTAAAAVVVHDEAAWAMEAWALRLYRTASTQAMADPVPQRASNWPARAPALALAALLLTTSLVAASAWGGPWPPSPEVPSVAAEPTQQPARLESLLHANGLDNLRVEPPAVGSTTPSLRGILATEEACERLNLVRQQMDADRFNDEVACLPDALRSATDFLAGTGLVVRLEEGSLAISGRLLNASMRGRLDTVLNQLRPSVPMSVEIEEAGLALPAQEQMTRQIRNRVLALHPGSPGYVLMRDGERVFEGGRLPGGLELARVGEESLTLRQGQNDIEVAL